MDPVAEALREMSIVNSEREDYQSQMVDIVQALIDRGVATARIYELGSFRLPTYAERINALETALTLDPDNSEYRYRYSAALLRQERYGEAAQQLRTLQANPPEGVSGRRISDMLRSAESRTPLPDH